MKKVLLILLAMVFVMPLVMTVVLSFRGENNTITLQNYSDLLFNCFIFYPMFWNSVLYAIVITLIQFLVIIPCAFGFINARFKGKNILFVFYIILMMMPLQVTILPNYIGLRDIGLINTHWSIILPAIFSPFGVVIMNQYMQGTDNSVIEAMRLETSSIIRIIIHAVIPQIRICIFATGLFVFADCWNMLEQPMLFLREDSLKTLSVFIANADKYAGNIMLPAAVIFMIPVLLLYRFFNQHLEKGLTFGELS
ncbi:MAG: carbohydrate ABC transporter permease [Oscillospiraceae bacterium]|nr:carbohydrate ABC transporter permease [Oscillospiraceae bacterium]